MGRHRHIRQNDRVKLAWVVNDLVVINSWGARDDEAQVMRTMKAV